MNLEHSQQLYTDLRCLGSSVNDTFVNVFGIVRYISRIKRTYMGDYHVMIGMFDQSLPAGEQIVVNFFFETEEFISYCKIGYLLRINNAHVQKKKTKANLTVSLRNINLSYVIFGPSGKFVHSSHPNTSLDEFTFKQIKQLLDFKLSEGNKYIDGKRKMLKSLVQIKDLKNNVYSNFQCQVIAAYSRTDECVILRVWDGTPCNVKLNPINIKDATTIFQSAYLVALAGDLAIHLSIYGGHIVTAKNIQEGDVVELVNLQVYHPNCSIASEICMKSGTDYQRGIRILANDCAERQHFLLGLSQGIVADGFLDDSCASTSSGPADGPADAVRCKEVLFCGRSSSSVAPACRSVQLTNILQREEEPASCPSTVGHVCDNVASTNAAAAKDSEKVLLLDCDGGTDAAPAVLLALRCSEVCSLAAVTTVFGAAPSAAQASRNITRIFNFMKIRRPVVSGCEYPLTGRKEDWETVNPSGCLKGMWTRDENEFPADVTLIAQGHASNFIVEAARMNAGKLTVVSLGPLTNIAVALKLDEKLGENIKELIILGGNVAGDGGGEFNFSADPEAVEVVFSGLSSVITLVPVELCKELGQSWEWHKSLIGNGHSSGSQFISGIERLYVPRLQEDHHIKSKYYQYGLVAMMVALDRRIIKRRQKAVVGVERLRPEARGLLYFPQNMRTKIEIVIAIFLDSFAMH